MEPLTVAPGPVKPILYGRMPCSAMMQAGRILFVPQLDRPCSIDTHGRPYLYPSELRWRERWGERMGGEERGETVIGMQNTFKN